MINRRACLLYTDSLYWLAVDAKEPTHRSRKECLVSRVGASNRVTIVPFPLGWTCPRKIDYEIMRQCFSPPKSTNKY